MISRLAVRTIIACSAAATIVASQAAEFTVISVSGAAQAGRKGSALTTIQAGDAFSSGTILETGKDGRISGQFDGRNAFVVQPESTVRVVRAAVLQSPAVRLTLEKGKVESALEAWPAGVAYEVASAAGVFVAHGTSFAVGYRLGPGGEFLGGTDVASGEVEYIAPECSVPSLTARGGMSISRTLGLESVLLEVTANGNGLVLVLGGRHRLSVPAGATVRIGMALRYMERFAAVWVDSGSVSVGGQAITPADRALFIAGSSVLPNGGGIAFMEAVRVESGAYAQAQLPGLSDAQLAALQATQRTGARAVLDSAVGAGVLPMYQPPFVPERPISASLSPSGTP